MESQSSSGRDLENVIATGGVEETIHSVVTRDDSAEALWDASTESPPNNSVSAALRNARRDARGLDPVDAATFRGYYSAAQFRVETWNTAHMQLGELRRLSNKGSPIEAALSSVTQSMRLLNCLEYYHCLKRECIELQTELDDEHFDAAFTRATRIAKQLLRETARDGDMPDPGAGRPHFEVLVVDELLAETEDVEPEYLRNLRSNDDHFIYDVVIVPSFEDAIIAILFNDNIQACVVHSQMCFESVSTMRQLRHHYVGGMILPDELERAKNDASGVLAEVVARLRPEVDLYKVADTTVGSVNVTLTRVYRRVFYRYEDLIELHYCILKGISERFETPFFDAIKRYSQKPTGVFHALPISRANSINRSRWITDMLSFYGRPVFMAETSSTGGGLDSLLRPTGPLKLASEKMQRAFGSLRSYFVTNGTSTANKIVTQAIVRPGDICLMSHDCHKSHPYAQVLAGAHPLYLEPYALDAYAILGGVSIAHIIQQLLALRDANKLSRVRMVMLTNSTFDGLVYDPFRVMLAVLAVKPDMVFLWDEAWFAFACASPLYRRRTSMNAASRLAALFASDSYAERFAAFRENVLGGRNVDDVDSATLLAASVLLADPARARVRVYATHSTHKTLTSFRQGSMVHIWDQDFQQRAELAFQDAYMTHTSTSPNYQILASLDVGRRQLELEGYEFVRHSVGISMMIRTRLQEDKLLTKYFRVLTPADMIPSRFRPSQIETFYSDAYGFERLEEHWSNDEFALDATRITLDVSRAGMSGDTMRSLLMEKYDIQINKTSYNSVLFIVNIGTTRGAATYLLDVLTRIADKIEKRESYSSNDARLQHQQAILHWQNAPPVPKFSRFHQHFVSDLTGGTLEGDMRSAYFLAHSDADTTTYVELGQPLLDLMDSGKVLVSAAFVTPYPPGQTTLVVGQVITHDIVEFLMLTDVKEIHGYDPVRGLLVFRDTALKEEC